MIKRNLIISLPSYITKKQYPYKYIVHIYFFVQAVCRSYKSNKKTNELKMFLILEMKT